jgi:hypothetical protein
VGSDLRRCATGLYRVVPVAPAATDLRWSSKARVELEDEHSYRTYTTI